MNIQNLCRGIAYTLTACATLMTGATLTMRCAPETSKEIITIVKDTYDNMKDRIETEQAIKAEGIQAQSYAEAKIKLDSIRLNRACQELGIPVPKKPAVDAPYEDQIRYELEITKIYGQQTNNMLEKIGNASNN